MTDNQGKDAKKLRPLSLSKLPHLSEGLPPFPLDESLKRQSNHNMKDGTGTAVDDSIRDSIGFSQSCISGSSHLQQENPDGKIYRNDPNLNWMNLPPRTNWSVSDSNLKFIPSYNPPMIPANCTYISDASPSIVAARIAQCLTKRSLIAEYDDEQASATVYAMDMGSFEIHLYKGNKRGPEVTIPPSQEDSFDGDEEGLGGMTQVARPDFSHGVVVECTRIRGDAMAFRRDCQAVLASARGETDGIDELRRPLGVLLTSRFGCNDIGADASWNRSKEYSHGSHGGNRSRKKEKKGKSTDNDDGQCSIKGLLPPRTRPSSLSLSKPSSSISPSRRNMEEVPVQQSDIKRSVCTALEIALSNIEKDRLDAQVLGMQSFVLLTDLKSSRPDKAYLSSLCVLGSPMSYTTSLDMNCSSSSLDCGEEEGDEERVEGVLATSTITRIHERIRWIIMRPGDDIHNDDSINPPSTPKDNHHQHRSHSSLSEGTDSSSIASCATTTPHRVGADLRISLRRMAIMAFNNALSTILSHSDKFPLLPPLHCPTLYEEDFAKRLELDLAGAARPPMAMLACAHDAALATRLLRLIGRYYSIENGRSRSENNTRDTYGLLERARIAGMSCHSVLEMEARTFLLEAISDEKSHDVDKKDED